MSQHIAENAVPFEDGTFVRDTTNIQTESLVNFMAALGYEPVWEVRRVESEDPFETRILYGKEFLTGFKQRKFRIIGREKVSVNTAIYWHNEEGVDALNRIHSEVERAYNFDEKNELFGNDRFVDDIAIAFAASCRIVKRVKAQYSRKRGLEIQNHKVQFQTHRDRKQYGF